MAKRIFNLEILQEHALAKGGELLSKEFINSTTLYLWRCTSGHKWKATALEVLGKKSGIGKWCPKCPQEHKTLLNLDDFETD